MSEVIPMPPRPRRPVMTLPELIAELNKLALAVQDALYAAKEVAPNADPQLAELLMGAGAAVDGAMQLAQIQQRRP